MKVCSSILIMLFVSSCSLVVDMPEGGNAGLKVSVIDISLDSNTFGTEWIYGNRHLIDIGSYSNIDSIVFEAGVRSQFTDLQCEVELYDHSIDQPVIGSRIRSVYNYLVHTIRSGNIERTFPENETQLSFRFRSTGESNYSRVISARILVYYQ